MRLSRKTERMRTVDDTVKDADAVAIAICVQLKMEELEKRGSLCDAVARSGVYDHINHVSKRTQTNTVCGMLNVAGTQNILR